MRQAKSELRENFFARIEIDTILSLFDLFSDVCFFIKDSEGRLIAANTQLLYRYNVTSESDLIGKTDFDFVPQSLAEKYKKDDMHIIESRLPMLNIHELVLTPLGSPGWYVTSKLPVVSKDGEVIGIMGTISKHAEKDFPDAADSPFYRILEYIDDNYNSKLTIGEMARHFNVSSRYIQRYFKQHFSVSPQIYIIQTRILKSCDYLRRGKSIAFAADECGFYDQSSFSKHFKKHMGLTPMQYLKNFT